MAYATVQDLIDRLGEPRLVQLTDLEQPATGAIVEGVAQRALDDAGAEIDGYLVGRYALPLASPPAMLRVMACDLAYARLLGSAVDEATAAARKQAISYLASVARGDIALLPPSSQAAPAGTGSVVFAPGAKTFGREE